MSLPVEFVESLHALGPEMAGAAEALDGPAAAAAIRLNATKGFNRVPDGAIAVEWCAGGYRLPGERPRFTLDPALHQGLYYVQDSSSMAIAAAVSAAVEVLGDNHGLYIRYLDACAAPGGKTVATVDTLPPDALVIANEYDPRRASVLRENIIKHGSGRVAVTRGDASAMRFTDDFFDIIAADVPCSGEGMMRKEAVARTQWSPGLVASCAALQRDIITNLWQALRPGGCLIYSTCTFNLDENEHMVDYIARELGADILPIAALMRPEIINACGGYDFPSYRFVPGHVDGEGQFVALLRKHGDSPHAAVSAKRRNSRPQPCEYLKGDYVTVDTTDGSAAVHANHASDLDSLGPKIVPIYRGVALGTVKGRDFIPSQALAMAADIDVSRFCTAEIGTATALEYLRRNAITLPEGTPRGIVLLTLDGYPLGWVKNLGNRANNLYPAPWRILSSR